MIIGTLLAAATVKAEDTSVATLGDYAGQRWVRTQAGWERATWEKPAFVLPPDPHPLVIATLQCLLGVAALVAFPARASVRTEPSI